MRFGKVEATDFNKVPDPARPGHVDSLGEPAGIGESASRSVYQHLVHNGLIDREGNIQDLYNPNRLGFQEYFTERIPEAYRDEDSVARIMAVINRKLFRDRMVKPARTTRQLEPNMSVLDSDEFLAFWSTVAKRTRYLVTFDTEQLIADSASSIRNMGRIQAPSIKVEIARLQQTQAGVREDSPYYVDSLSGAPVQVLPDIITMIQSETDLTRRTIARILSESGRLADFAVNPQAFITATTGIIKERLNTCLMDGLKYELLEDGRIWEVRELASRAPSPIDDGNLFTPGEAATKTVWDGVPTDSGTEIQFANRLDTDERVKYYVKLPDWFRIDTPIGQYNPDWAVMFEDERTFYLVRETKGSTLESARRVSENMKVQAARAHYEAIGVDCNVATSWDEVVRSLR